MSSRRFSEVSALTAREPGAPGQFEAVADENWTIAGKPNGGYLFAMTARAAAEVAPHKDVLAASAHYLRPPSPGRVEVAAQVLRSGRSAAQVRATLSQDGKTCVEALITLGTAAQEDKPLWTEGAPPAAGASYENSVHFHPLPPFRPPIFDQIEIRLDPATAGFVDGNPAGRGELRGWLALPDGEDFDSVSLLYALDAFPPATLDIERSGWVPTLELTAYIRAVPAPGPVRVLQKAQLIAGGYVDEVCLVWDSEDHLVAQGTQFAGIRFS